MVHTCIEAPILELAHVHDFGRHLSVSKSICARTHICTMQHGPFDIHTEMSHTAFGSKKKLSPSNDSNDNNSLDGGARAQSDDKSKQSNVTIVIRIESPE